MLRCQQAWRFGNLAVQTEFDPVRSSDRIAKSLEKGRSSFAVLPSPKRQTGFRLVAVATARDGGDDHLHQSITHGFLAKSASGVEPPTRQDDLKRWQSVRANESDANCSFVRQALDARRQTRAVADGDTTDREDGERIFA